MSSKEFCAGCGRVDVALANGVCADCAADRVVLAAAGRRAEIVLCPSCGARRSGGLWDRAGETPVLTADDLTPLIEVHPEAGLRRVDWTETRASPTIREFVGRAHLVFRGAEREVEIPLSVRLVARSCPECSRRSGRFYTAIVQLRGPATGPHERSRELRDRLGRTWTRLLEDARPDWRNALSWHEERPEGLDCYFTNTLAARSIARLAKQRFGAAMTESASLFGRRKGQEVYRVTFCLRFGREAGPTPAPHRRPAGAAPQPA
jgi:60S ribosomal export protein NMD3